MNRTQTQRLIDYLSTGKPITPMMALRRFGIGRLAARIRELREAQHKITTDMVKRGGARVAQYRLAKR